MTMEKDPEVTSFHAQNKFTAMYGTISSEKNLKSSGATPSIGQTRGNPMEVERRSLDTISPRTPPPVQEPTLGRRLTQNPELLSEKRSINTLYQAPQYLITALER